MASEASPQCRIGWRVKQVLGAELDGERSKSSVQNWMASEASPRCRIGWREKQVLGAELDGE